MSTRFTWMIGFAILLSIGLLVACGSHYSASSDGLVIVPSQGAAVVQSFSFNLSNGHVSTVNTHPTVSSIPSAIVLDPTGSYAYVASYASSAISGSGNMISSYKINSDGTLTAAGTTTVNGNPVALAIDSGGKFLFAANGIASTVSVFSVSSGAALAEVAGSPFPVPAVQGGAAANLTALAPTPTAFPTQNTACSNSAAPTTEYLYVTDAQNNVVWEFPVSTSTGALTLPAVSFPTGTIPAGVAVDPCNQYAYVSNQLSNDISEYAICNRVLLPTCSVADGSLVSIGAVSTGNGPGPMVISPFGNFLYVLDKSPTANAGEISSFQIGQVDGVLMPTNPATAAAGNSPVSIAVRSDGNWLFVTNSGSSSGNGSVSEYAITPASGALTPSGTGITTDTFPFGVAVK